MLWDFNSISQEIKNRLALQSKWNSVLYYGIYERLSDIVAYVLEKIAYTADILYSMASWSTTTSLKSLNIFSKLLSYTPYRKTGASGAVLISADPTFNISYVYSGLTVTIPKWTKFTNTNKTINIYSSDTYTYNTGTIGNLNISVKEGTPKSYTYIASGIANEVISIFSDNIENDYLDIYIIDSFGNILNTVTINTNLYFINDLINYNCKVENFDDFQGIYITFGDGISVRKLSAGEIVLVKYAETQGSLGNIESTDIITVIKDTLYDFSATEVTLYVNNTESISDGTEYEDLESIRNNGSNLFYAGYRCGTLTDWKSIIESFSFIYKATIWTINDVGGSTLLDEQNKIYLTAISTTGDEITTAQKTIISNLLDASYKSPSEVLSFNPLVKIYVVFIVDAVIQNKTQSVMIENIKTALYEAYSTTYVDFKQNIYFSNYISLINEIEDVIHHNTTMKIMEYNLDSSTSNKTLSVYYDSISPEEKITVTTNSLLIYVKRKIAGEWQTPELAGHASGTSFVSDNYTISGSNINYTTNVISFVVDEIYNDVSETIYGVQNPGDSDELGYIITLQYNTEDGNGEQTQDVRLPYRYQITDVDVDFLDVTASY